MEQTITSNNKQTEPNDVLSKEIFSAYDLLHSDMPEPEWIIEPLIPSDGVTAIIGKQTSCKSFVALYIAFCCASGQSFLEFPTKKCRVLYIDEENNKPELKRRLKLLEEGMSLGESLKSIGLRVFQGLTLNKDGRQKLEKIIAKHNPGLIIIDSLIRVFDGEENSAKDTKKVFDCIKGLKPAFLILHHTRKSNAKRTNINDARGSGELQASPSSLLILNRCGETLVLSHEKSRSTKDKQEIKFLMSDTNHNGKKGILFTPVEHSIKDTEFKQHKTMGDSIAEKINTLLQQKPELKRFKTGSIAKEIEHNSKQTRDGLLLLKAKGSIKEIGEGIWEV